MCSDVTNYALTKSIGVGLDKLGKLKDAAIQTPQKIARICLHRNHKDHIQEMLIAIHRDTYLAPHKQPLKEKSYIIIEGEMRLAFFDDNGTISNFIDLSESSGAGDFICRFDAGRWHTPVSKSLQCVYLEIIPGPFEPDKTCWADWAPSVKKKEEISKFKNCILFKE